MEKQEEIGVIYKYYLWFKHAITNFITSFILLSMCIGAWDIFKTIDNLLKNDKITMSLSTVDFKKFKPRGF